MKTYTIEVDKNYPDVLKVVFKPLDNVTEESSIAQSSEVKQDILDIYNEHPEKQYYLLVDLSFVNKEINVVPKESVKKYYDVLKHDQTIKMAVLGVSELHAKLAMVISEVLTKKLGWFSYEKEAYTFFDK